jgi:GT2 family glycosyltransferase
MNKKVFVIIVTYNALNNNWIGKCLEALSNSEFPLEIVVVDNNSSDDTVNFIKNNYPGVHLVEKNENVGFGQANNLGICYAYKNQADYFFLINQDVYIQPDTVTLLVEQFNINPNYGILSPIHLNGDGTKLDYKFSNYIIPKKCPEFYSDKVLKRDHNKVYESQFVNAASWLLSRQCIETVGGFNPSFFHYGEDDNYIERLQFHNLKLGVVSDAYIYHDRDNRLKNDYFDNSSLVYERGIVLKASNPNIKFLLLDEIKMLKKLQFRELLYFRKKQISLLRKQIETLQKLDKESIEDNRYQTTLKQPSFLNL